MLESKKYFLLEDADGAHHAGSKARDDVSKIIGATEGWLPIKLRRVWGAAPAWKRVLSAGAIISDWLKISHTVTAEDTLLIQFPLPYYPKIGRVALPLLKRIKNRGVKTIYLIHDLDSLRGLSQQTETDFIACADVLIAHNDIMAARLKELYGKPVVSLGIFDYLIPGFEPKEADGSGIDVAGNLNHEKAGYLYGLATKFPEAQFNLYGPNFDMSSKEATWYKGSFAPDDLPNHLDGAFGLIWDGDSAETCSGSYGEYLRINNPHKLSLYLACGKPVLIWDQAAEAKLVEQYGLGKAIPSISEGIGCVQSVSAEDFSLMKKRASHFGQLLREGHFTSEAIAKAQDCLRSM